MTKETENISKIRDILFGNNLTELEKRLTKTESFLRVEITSLDEKLTNRFDELKSSAKESFTAIDSQLQNEKEKSEKEIIQLREELYQIRQSVRQLDEKFSSEFGAIKQWLIEQQDGLSKQHQKTINDLKFQLFGQVDDLRQSKVERSALAVILSEIAMQMVDKEPATSDSDISVTNDSEE